jgi:hypothetical protein
VGVGLLALHGCATPRVDAPSTTVDRHVVIRPGRPGLVIAARETPPAADLAPMAAEIARRTGFGLVVAAAPGPLDDQRVREAAQGTLRLYAELHDHGGPPCLGRMAIATVGVDDEQMRRLRAMAELIRDAHLRGHREVARLDVLIAPVEGPGPDGTPQLAERALHIELPPCNGREWRETYTAILADFLDEAVTLAGR